MTQGPISPISALSNYVTSDGKQIGADANHTKLMLGLTEDLQQDLRHFCTQRKNQTQSQCQNRKPDYVMVIRHRSSHHLHEQPILQLSFWEPETQKDCQCTELRRRFRGRNELARGL